VSLRPRERIAARLVAIAKHDDTQKILTVKISQELLAEMIGVTRKTINQHLSAFEKDGLILVGYGRVDLIDLPKLKLISAGIV